MESRDEWGEKRGGEEERSVGGGFGGRMWCDVMCLEQEKEKKELSGKHEDGIPLGSSTRWIREILSPASYNQNSFLNQDIHVLIHSIRPNPSHLASQTHMKSQSPINVLRLWLWWNALNSFLLSYPCSASASSTKEKSKVKHQSHAIPFHARPRTPNRNRKEA